MPVSPETFKEWQRLANQAARRIGREVRKLPPITLTAVVSPECAIGVDRGIDTTFMARLKRGDHLNGDFLKGANYDGPIDL